MDAFYTQQSLIAVTAHTGNKGTLIALAFADAEGATRTVHPAEAATVVDAVVASGRPAWAWDATNVAQALGDPWPSLRDARTLADALDPGAYTESLRHHPIVKGAQEALGRTVPSTSRVSWLADAIAGDGHLREAYVTAEARVVARILADLRTATSGNVEGQHAAVASVDVEARYRALAARGIRIDEAALKRAQFAMKTATVLAHRDLKADRSKDNRATRAWVASLGVKTIDEFGEPAVDGEGLPLLSHKHAAEVPAGSAATWARYVELRDAVRTRSKLKELAGAVVDGRVHPRFSLAGGKTGRMTSSGPALFNLPKELRPMILAEEGHTFVGADLSQVEPRVAAILSGDPVMATNLAAGDPYAVLASRIWDEPVSKEDPRRDLAKTALLATIYGQGARRLAASLGLGLEHATRMRASVTAAWPTFAAWCRESQSAARRGERLHALSGRPLLHPDSGHKAVNYRVQGSAADLFLHGMVRGVDDALTSVGLPGSLHLAVHDELTVQVPIGAEQVAVEVLQKHMTTTINGVTISAKPKILGPAWGHP